MRYDYTAIAAPTRADKAKDAKAPTDRYALTLATELNRMAADGWEYVRAEVLPSEERSGLTGRTTVWHNLLIFRRLIDGAQPPAPVPQPEYPVAATPMPDPQPAGQVPAAARPLPSQHAPDHPSPAPSATSDLDSVTPPPAPRPPR